jgi:hypothetical protein
MRSYMFSVQRFAGAAPRVEEIFALTTNLVRILANNYEPEIARPRFKRPTPNAKR